MRAKLKVKEKIDISNSFTRLVSEFLDPADFGVENVGDYLKLLFDGDDQKTQLRTLSISDFDENQKTLSIDFVKHHGGGPAAHFVEKAQIGDVFEIRNRPGIGQCVDLQCNSYVLAGDHTAFAALKTQVRKLTSTPTIKHICLIVESSTETVRAYFGELLEDDRVHLQFCDSSVGERRLANKIVEFYNGDYGKVGLWCAGERESINAVRKSLKTHPHLVFESKYLSSYWQKGLEEEQHKVLKKQDE